MAAIFCLFPPGGNFFSADFSGGLGRSPENILPELKAVLPNADFVIEGYVDPTKPLRDEGRFGKPHRLLHVARFVSRLPRHRDHAPSAWCCGLVVCGAMKCFLAMTTTISVSPKGQVELPEDFCKRKKIKPGTALRVTELGDGVYVTPVPEPTEKELREVIAAAGSLARQETPADEAMVQQVIVDYRDEKRRKRG